MKRIVLLLVLIMAACSSQGQEVQVKNRTFNAMLQRLLDHNVPELSVNQVPSDSGSVIFLDARDQSEYDVSHIHNALRIGYDDFDLSRAKGIKRNQKIVVYCSVGYRSEKISQRLIKAGFSNVSNLYGGIFEWVNEGKPVYNIHNETTLNVHAFSISWGVWLVRGNKIYKSAE